MTNFHRNSTAPRWRPLAAACCVALLAGSLEPVASAHTTSATTDPAALVNSFIGTGSGGKVTGNVDTFPGAVVPFGMLSFSPATPSRPEGGDYFYGDHKITGFGLTHISGPGCKAAGEVPILPTTGAIGANPDAAAAAFDHAHESATPGEYQVTLDPGTPSAIDARLAATLRTGIGRFEFPATDAADFIFKVSDGQTASSASSVRIISNTELAGSETSGHFCGAASSATLYFVAKFHRPFTTHGTWGEGAPQPGSAATAGVHTGAWVTFDTRRQRVVEMKVAISYVSEADAFANLAAEDPGWDFAKVAGDARADWNHWLSRIRVDGGTRDQQVQFYSALYHVLLHPNVFSDANGNYIGFDNKVHTLTKGQDFQYANFSGWDIYRSEIPLLALLAPKRTSDMITSLLNDQAQGGWLPKWGYDNGYTGVMNGDAADPVIAEAYAFGARDFDTRAALAAMVKGATQTPAPVFWSGAYIERPNLRAYEHLGYVPGYPSETLEYAVADFAIAAFAGALGDAPTHARFLARAGDWHNVFNPKAAFRGYTGYVQSRARDGKFSPGAAFDIARDAYGQAGFEEGNALQYTWMVPQDIGGLLTAMGGDANATARLDLLFAHLNVGPNEPYYWAGNEMCLGTPWIYDYTGAAWKTQQVVHRILREAYSATPGGEPGNDDLGAMSSWLVWADLGLYPETPGTPVLVLGAPVFPHATITLADGQRIELDAPRASLDTYVTALTIDGRASHRAWLSADALLHAAATRTVQLRYRMATTPDRRWGNTASDRPPSWPRH